MRTGEGASTRNRRLPRLSRECRNQADGRYGVSSGVAGPPGAAGWVAASRSAPEAEAGLMGYAGVGLRDV